MPIAEPLYRFTPALVQGAPGNGGLFALWQDGDLIYVGRAASIKDCLLDHLRRIHPCTTGATHYSWELSLHPALREAELLEHYRKRFGRLPRCNQDAA